MKSSVAASIALFGFQALAQQHVCIIGGAVVDSSSNQPIARARVLVTASYSLMRITDDEGKFCFDSLDKGNYVLTVQKAGYLPAAHGVSLAVEENSEVKPVAVRMTRYGSVGGMVLDDRGESLPGADVTVWDRVRGKTGWGPEEVDSVNADARGSFRFNGLPPGTYYLSVSEADPMEHKHVFPFVDSEGDPPLEREVETFYSQSFTFSGATPVELQAGQQINDLAVTLKKTRLRSVSGRIANPPKSGVLDYYGESETGAVSTGAIPIAHDGTFVQVDLPPVRCTIRLFDGQRLIAHKEVDLTTGDALAITLEPIETIDVPVTFHTEGRGPAFRPRGPSAGKSLLVREGSDEAVALEIAPDGTYRFAGVEPAVYRLQLALADQALYLKGVSYGGETVTGSKLDLHSARQGGLELIFSAKVASLQGRAVAPSGAEGDENQNLTVILVDEAKGSAASIASQTGTDQKGRFQMHKVPPGKYRLYAIEKFDEATWRPEAVEALAGKSVELELKESEKKLVSVPIISADEWNAVLKKLGE